MVTSPEPGSAHALLTTMMLANTGGLGGPPVLNAPGDGMEASSASPTNATGSDVAQMGSHEFAQMLAASQLKHQEMMVQQIQKAKEAASLPAPQPIFNMAEAATLLQLSQLFSAQQAAVVAQQRAAAAMQQHQQQTAIPPPIPQERKRSYPCTFQWCVICQKDVHSSKLPCHIRQCHVAKPMFQCPACDFTSTYSKNNVKSHMVSLHGLAGDPISYMDKYAAQVEEYMKMCFPNVRGRGRPMHGRTSPNSPNSPNGTSSRRASQSSTATRRNSTNQQDVLAAAFAAQQRQAHELMGLNGLNPLSMFGNPAVLAAHNNNNTINSNQNLGGTAAVKPGNAIKLEHIDISGDSADNVVVSSSASSIDDLLNSVQNNIFTTASARSGSASSNMSTTTSTVRPGENMQPRYLSQKVACSVLNDDQISGTVFSRIGQASDLVERFDLSQFESLAETPLLTQEQVEKISDVRESLNLQVFEILYAIHKLDLRVLKADGVNRILSIAPSTVDAARFRAFEQSNATNTLGQDEQFILQLSKIERLEEKLAVMQYMANITEKAMQIGQSLSSLVEAGRTLQNSSEWQTILQLALTIANLVAGDFNAHTIKGFVSSQITEFCSHFLHNGHSLLTVMTSVINNELVDTARVVELIPKMEAAAEVSFSSILNSLNQLEECQLRAEREVEIGGANQPLSEFIRGSQQQIATLLDTMATSKEELCSVLSYMGEPLPRSGESFQPELFFSQILTFLRSLKEELSRQSA